jgi:hypothetical protein
MNIFWYTKESGVLTTNRTKSHIPEKKQDEKVGTAGKKFFKTAILI